MGLVRMKLEGNLNVDCRHSRGSVLGKATATPKAVPSFQRGNHILKYARSCLFPSD